MRAWVAQWVRYLDYPTTHISLLSIRRGFASGFVNYKKRCTRLAATSDNVYQLLAHGRWFSPGTLASSTTKTGRHDIAEILLKVALNTKIQIQIYVNSLLLGRKHLFYKQKKKYTIENKILLDIGSFGVVSALQQSSKQNIAGIGSPLNPSLH